MNQNMFLKRLLVAVEFLFLCAAPALTFGQASPGVTPSAGVRPARAHRPTYISPTEYLAGLTLTDEQKTKINQIREDTKSRMAAVGKDEKLGPEVKEAMIGGYQRIENSKIYAVLTPAQQQQVRTKVAGLRAEAQQHRDAAEHAAAPGKNPQSK